ncbi:hypothetical protein ZWY2020_040974, partial [Hordeum vulgare]
HNLLLRRRGPHQRAPRHPPLQHRLPPPRQGCRPHRRGLYAPPRSPSTTPTSSRLRSPLPHWCPASSPPTQAPSAPSASPRSPSAGTARTTFLALTEWLGHLADKGVEDLTLGNRPFSFDVLVQHPATLLRCGASLRRLYLGVWLFPFTTDLPRGPDVFPNLQELGLCHGITEERDLEYVLACNPKLETLALVSNYGYPDRVRIGSRSLRCMLLWHSLADEVAVVSAPSLQRLIIYCTHTSVADGVIKVKIGHAPQLVVLGYLDTATQQLEIGNTIIKDGVTNVCPNTVLPSVKVLALKVRFRVPKKVRTLLYFLRCFPGVETLHIMVVNILGEVSSTKLTLEQQDEVAQAEANDNSFLSSNEINSTSIKLDKVDTLDARADEIACETKVKHARYLLHYLVPCLSDLNRDQMVEREIEAKIQVTIAELRSLICIGLLSGRAGVLS